MDKHYGYITMDWGTVKQANTLCVLNTYSSLERVKDLMAGTHILAVNH